MATQNIIDISIPINDGMISWPGDPAVEVSKTMDVACGDCATVSRLNMGSHTGTHVDAISHFKADGLTIDQMDLSVYVGPVLVVDVPQMPEITAKALFDMDINWSGIQRVIFKTDNSKTQWWAEPFNNDFVHLSLGAAQFLTGEGVQLIGIDYLSVEGFYSQGAVVHHHLLEHQVHIVEGLNLTEVIPGWYEIVCLPLKIANGDGAPARVILRR